MSPTSMLSLGTLLTTTLLLAPAHSATYYVSSSAGDDTAAGTSPATAWRSLAKAGRYARLHTAADALLLRRGDQWLVDSGDALVLRNASGLVSSYGDTTATNTQPLIQVSSRASWAACVRLYDASELTVSGLRLTGCGAGVLVTQSLPLTRDIAIVSNVFADIRGPMQNFLPAGSSRPAPWVQDWGVAVALATLNTTTTPTRTLNLTVANNAAVRIDQFYTNSQPGPGWNDGSLGGRRRRRAQNGAQRMRLTVEGCALRGNTVQACGYNCIEMGGTTHMTLSDSVFLRDTPPDMFVYGTTDVILGGVDGTSAIRDNDFNRRGEYEGGPDGCAIDFETSSSGVAVEGNTIFKSWGAGIMVFGHQTTSHNLSISNNTFIQAGCIQTRGDRAAIAFTCPHHNKASGKLNHNLFQTCTGKGVVAEAYHEGFPGCTSDWAKVGNLIDSHDPAARVVDEPRLNVAPSEASSAVLPVTAQSITPGVTFRFTLDGSRPTLRSPVMPAGGVRLPWPGPVLAINVRGFKDGWRPSITNGVVLELNYPWPLPGQPPPPPAPPPLPPCAGGEQRLCGACTATPRALAGLQCPPGQMVDFVVAAGDDGSCSCHEYCASGWNGLREKLRQERPHWSGATAVTANVTRCHGAPADNGLCLCVQGSHWCDPQADRGQTPCSATCAGQGVPTPRDFCVPIL